MRYGTTLILLAVFLVAAALIWTFKDQLTGEAKPPEKPTETRPLIENVKMDDLVSATLEERAAQGKARTKLALKKIDGKWEMSEPVESAADDYEVGRLLRAAVEGQYRIMIEPGAKGQPTLESLDLAPPAYRLTLTTAAKGATPARTIIVSVGKRSAVGADLYVRVDDSPKAAVLDRADLLERAEEKTNTYRSRDLVTTPRDDVVRIDLEGEKTGDKGRVQLDLASKERDRWVLSQPISARADEEAAQAAVRAATGASARDFIEDNPKDLARYGLGKPRLTVTVWKKGAEAPKAAAATAKAEEKTPPKAEPVKAAVLRFGSWADLKHDTVYCLTEDSKHVVTVSATALKDLNRSAAELRDKHVLAVEWPKATQITARIPPKLAEGNAEVSYELVKSAGEWKLKAAGRPEVKADAEALEGLQKDLSDLKVLYYAEGENADIAKSFTPAGAVRVKLEGEPTEQGVEFGGAGLPAEASAKAGEVPSIVKNLREDWVGRFNEKSLTFLRRDWLAFIDRQVFKVDPKKVARIAIQTPDRKVVLEKKADKWRLAEPVQEDALVSFVPDLLRDLEDLRCEKFVAAAKDFKPYGLDPAEVTCTLTLEPEKKDGKAAEQVLRLGHWEKSKVAGRVDSSDLVFQVPSSLFQTVADEPVEKALVQGVFAQDVDHVELVAGATKVKLVKADSRWYRQTAAGAPGEEVQAEAVQDIVSAAAGLSAARWASYDAKDPARFGLDKPAIRITLATSRGSTTILVSDKEVPAGVVAMIDQRPARYAMVEDGPRIGIIAGKPLDTLLGAAKAFEPKKEEPKKESPKKEEAKPAEKKPAPAAKQPAEKKAPAKTPAK